MGIAGAGAVVEGEQIVGHKIAIVLAQVDAAVVALQGQIHLALVEIGVAEVGVGSGELGIDPNRFQQGLFGQVGKAGFALGIGQIGQGLGVIAALGNGPFKGGNALAVAPQVEQDVAEVVEGLGKIALEL